MNDNGDDDSPASPFFDRGDIDPDLSEATELHRRDIFNRRRPCGVNSLAVQERYQPVAEMATNNPSGRISKGKNERRRAVKLLTFHRPLRSLIAGVLILIVPGLLKFFRLRW
jgi:hypothetical protein